MILILSFSMDNFSSINKVMFLLNDTNMLQILHFFREKFMLRTEEITLEIPGNNSKRVIHAIFTWRRSYCADGRHTFFFNAFCCFEQRTPSGSRVNLQLFVRKKNALDGS